MDSKRQRGRERKSMQVSLALELLGMGVQGVEFMTLSKHLQGIHDTCVHAYVGMIRENDVEEDRFQFRFVHDIVPGAVSILGVPALKCRTPVLYTFLVCK